jgi:pimeloyl-ACP methyl ester carboxylesterase
MGRLQLSKGIWASWPGLRLIAADFVPPGKRQAWVERLAAITAPTLIVWGQQDGLLPVEQCAQASGLLPHAQMRIFEHSAHIPMLEEPERFNALVRRFLADGIP